MDTKNLLDQGVNEQEWKSSSPKYGWSLVLKRKKRNIIYLSPCKDCFRVSLVLGDRAINEAAIAPLSLKTRKALKEAPHYAEGTGLRLIVTEGEDLEDIETLTTIKLAN